MTLVLGGFVGVFGLAIGSFLNVVIYRVPAGISVIAPASACPGCGHAIRRRDNIPVLSWLLLGRRCRDCRAGISARYPAIELITALAFAAVALGAAPAIATAPSALAASSAVAELALLLYVAAISVALAMIDIDTHRLPDAIVLPSYLVVAGLVASAGVLSGHPERLAVAAIGGAGSVLFYFILAFAYPGGMGFGDVKLAGVLGIVLGWFGWGPLAVGSISAFVLGGVFGIALLLLRRAGRKSGLPFGPWMLAGAWVGVVAGEPLARLYLSLVGLA